MPCTKCRADFNLLNWKLRCIDCEQFYCSKCLKKLQGVLSGLCCDTCLVLNKRPPDREKLMELRAKDLRDYLNRNHVSTHGLVEKGELVELFYRLAIPAHNSRNKGNRFSTVFSGSVPNLASNSQEHINIVRSNVEANINNVRTFAENAIHNLGRRVNPNVSQTSGANFENYSFVYSEPIVPEPQRRSSTHEFSRSPPPRPPQPQASPQEPVRVEPQAAHHKLPKLADYKSVNELGELSVKQLKELLTLNRVDYKGCVEKSELLDRATRLWLDNNMQKKEDFEEASVDNLCKICMDAPLDCVILECGHMATCVDCGKQLAECPICRQFVTRVVRTFKA